MTRYDVVVVGGGPAGLQAALTLGRMHRRTLLLDAGGYRNDPTEHLHNMLTQDGARPADLRAAVRAELAAYPDVEVRDVGAADVVRTEDGFEVHLAGGERVRTERVVLATGVCDTLPDVPGLEPLFGSVAAHCPFCHGHEFAGGPVAVLGSHGHVAGVAAMMRPIASEVVVATLGEQLDAATAAGVARLGVVVRPEPVTGLTRTEGGARVEFADGPALDVAGLIVATTFAQRAPFAERLGARLLPSGCVAVDPMGRTSVPGLYAAGDLAHLPELPMPLSSVLGSAAAGQAAASGCVADDVMAAVAVR